MGLGIELAEQIKRRSPFHAEPQRRRASGTTQPDGPDVTHDESELVLNCLPYGPASGTADIEVRSTPFAVRDGEVFIGQEGTKGDQREADPDGNCDGDVGRRV